MPTAHAVLGASSAHKWLNCPPSAQLERQCPDQATEYAQEGTLAHSWCEKWLIKGQFKGITLKKYQDLPAEMREATEAYRDYVEGLYKDVQAECPDAIRGVEVRLDYSQWVPKGFGTGDCVIVSDKVLHVIDFKYGKGVAVAAEDNPQMKLYAAGALAAYGDFYDFDRIVLHIFQPRIDNIVSWETDRAHLLAWLEAVVTPLARLAWEGGGQQVAGEHCRFCRAKVICRVRSEFMETIAAEKDKTLSNEEIADLLPKLDDLQKWAKGLQEYALQHALEGETFSGYKLVEGRSNRKIADPDGLAEMMHSLGVPDSQIFKPREMQTITSYEKTFGKKGFAEAYGEYLGKPEGKPALVPVSDKRPEWRNNTPEDDFADLVTA